MSRGTALLYTENGEITGTRSGAIANIQIDIDRNGGRGIFLEPDEVPDDTSLYYVSDDGELTLKGDSPHDTAVYDFVAKAWSYDLDRHKEFVWSDMKKARDAQEFGTFTWSTYTFDCDEASQRRIQSAVQQAANDSTMTMPWTLADNSVETFTAAQYAEIGNALANHISTTHERGRIVRGLINAATNQADLEAINW